MDTVTLNQDEYHLTESYDFLANQYVPGEDLADRLIWTRENIINGESGYYLKGRDAETCGVFHQDAVNGMGITAMLAPAWLRETAVGLTKAGRDAYHSLRDADGWDLPAPAALVAEFGQYQPYVSGVLTSRDGAYKHSQLFGYWEFTARLPLASGAWPAFWLLPTHEQWPEGIDILPEIDVMEGVREVIDGGYHASLHARDTGAKLVSTGELIETGADLVNDAHRYGLSWEPDYIVWFFDGQEVRRMPTPADMQDVPRHWLANLAVGGSWAGEPVADDYPATLYIESVKVYQKRPQAKEASGRGDIVHVLDDGREVTQEHINLVTEYLMELTRANNARLAQQPTNDNPEG